MPYIKEMFAIILLTIERRFIIVSGGKMAVEFIANVMQPSGSPRRKKAIA